MPTKEYYWKHKETLAKKNKEYHEKNKEKHNEYMKEYHRKNAEIDKEYRRENPHVKTISQWKSRGIKLRPNEDWLSVYLFYITCEECENCGVELTTDRYNTSTTRCLDHDHSTGFIRDVLCNACNVERR
jgi:alpha-galactosidase/6-phospho-beta-glucosidase family protein